MLSRLRRVLAAGGGSPAETAAALREALLAAYLSQIGLLLLAALLAAALTRPRPDRGGWALVFLLASGFAQLAIAGLAERRSRQGLAGLLGAALLLASGAVVPAALGLALAVLEGPSNGAGLLALASAGLLLAGLGRVGRYAQRGGSRGEG